MFERPQEGSNFRFSLGVRTATRRVRFWKVSDEERSCQGRPIVFQPRHKFEADYIVDAPWARHVISLP